MREEGTETINRESAEQGGGEWTPQLLLREHEQHGLTYQQIADKYDIKRETVSWRIRDARTGKDSISTLMEQITNPLDGYEAIPAYDELDMERWKTGLASLPDKYTVAVATDKHMPDMDMRAFELHVRIMEDVKPNIYTAGSDAHDFRNLSRFIGTVRDMDEDAWCGADKQFIDCHKAIDHVLAPNAYKPFTIGNHDIRWIIYLMQQSPKFKRLAAQDYVRVVRESGCLWLGWDFDTIELETVIISHGERHGVNAARRAGDDISWVKDFIQGHVHYFSSASKTTKNGVREAHTTGCLCNNPPLYERMKGKSKQKNWQHGFHILTVDKVNMTTGFEPIVFTADYGAVFRGKWYQVKKQVYR